MAFLKKQAAAAAEPFRVPTLIEGSPEYSALIDKRADLLEKQSAARTERRDLERAITESPAPTLRPGVAELLGETSDSTTGLRARLADVIKLERDVETALEVVRQRLAVARTAASKAICLQVKPEYSRRVAAICDALKAVAAARAEYDALRDELDREDVAWGSLGPVSLGFLGDARDGHVQRFIREAREAGYHG